MGTKVDPDKITDRVAQLLEDSPSFKQILLYGTGAIVAYLAITPLAFLIWTSVWSGDPGQIHGQFTLQHFVNAYTNPDTYTVFIDTFLIAIGGLAIALFYGVGIAWFLSRTDIPTKDLIETAVVMPIAVSPFFYAFMYIFTYGPRLGMITTYIMDIFNLSSPPFNIFSIWGVALVNGIVLVPTAYLLTAPSFSDMDPALEEISHISGAGHLATFRSISLPLIKPALMSSILIIFLRGLGTFSIVAILGFPAGIDVFATEIWEATDQTAPPQYGYSASLSVTFLIIAFVLIWYNRRVTSRSEDYMTITGQGFQPRQFSLGKWRWPIAGFIWLNIIVIWLLPIAIMVLASFHPLWQGEIELGSLTLEHYKDLLNDPLVESAFYNTTIITVVGSIVGTVLMLLFGYYVERTDYRFRRIADFLSVSTIAAPGIILGVGVLFVYLWLGSLSPIDLYGTKWVMLIGMITLFLPTISRMAIGNIGQIHTELEESAYIFGASWYEQMKEIFLPLTKGTAGAIFFYLFIHLLRHLAVVLILYSRGNEVFSVILFNGWYNNADIEFVSALSSVFILSMICILVVVRRAGFSFYAQHQ